MKKQISTLSYQVLYYAVLFLSAAGIFIIGSLAISLAVIIAAAYRETNDLAYSVTSLLNPGFTDAWIRIAAIIGGLLLEGTLYIARIRLRRYTDFNEEGLSKKYSDYERLSAKDKAEIDKQKLADRERILSSSTLRQMTYKGSASPEEDMKKLIGLDNVKQSMREMVARMEYNIRTKRKRDETSCMHMCFLGPPGTGKTTSARIMTGFLHQYKYIRKNQCIEVDGNFLKGTHVGETTLKTSMLVKKALGGVLFIDEAYALLDSPGGGFGQEAIATLVKEMEDHRKDLVIIFAGYDKPMKALINSNPGLQSRIISYLYFDNYSTEDLGRIFISMANKRCFCVTSDALDKFKDRINKETKTENFGNARSVRNHLEAAINRHAVNLKDKVLSKDFMFTLCPEDIV